MPRRRRHPPLSQDPVPETEGPHRAGHHPSGQGGGRRRGPRWQLLGSLAVTLAVLTALFAFGLRRDPNALASAIVGKPAPDFALRAIDGTHVVRLADLRGQVVVMNFWASWCAPCRVEHPALEATWERYRDQGVVVLGVSFQDAMPAVLAFASTYRTTWPLVQDPGSAVALRYGVTGVPETFVIGPDGRIAAKYVAAVRYGQLSAEIDRLLRGGRA